MVNNYRKIGVGVLSITLVMLLNACGQTTISSYDDYLQWLNDVENGLVVNKEVNGITLKVKHLPAHYLAYQDLSNKPFIKKEVADSIINKYSKSLTFLVTIGVDGQIKKGDVMYQGVRDYEAYKERLYAMNFDIEEDISITMDGLTYQPVLSHLENGYGLTDSRNIMVVFVPHTKEEAVFYASQDIQFTYDDEIFNTGINHFQFNRSDINRVPTFTFWN